MNSRVGYLRAVKNAFLMARRKNAETPYPNMMTDGGVTVISVPGMASKNKLAFNIFIEHPEPARTWSRRTVKT